MQLCACRLASEDGIRVQIISIMSFSDISGAAQSNQIKSIYRPLTLPDNSADRQPHQSTSACLSDSPVSESDNIYGGEDCLHETPLKPVTDELRSGNWDYHMTAALSWCVQQYALRCHVNSRQTPQDSSPVAGSSLPLVYPTDCHEGDEPRSAAHTHEG